MAERRRFAVKRNAERVRLLLLAELIEDIQKSVNCVGVLPIARGEQMHAVKRAVDDAVAVKDQQLHTAVPFLKRASKQRRLSYR